MIADIIKRITQIGLVAVLVLGFVNSGFTQVSKEKEPEAPKETKENIIKSVTKEVSGEISAIGKDYISIIYKRDEKKGTEYEMLVPIDTSTKLERKKSLSELNIGDTVKIQCEDMTLEDTSGEKKMERKAKVISFVSPAVKKPEPPRLPEPGEGLPND